MNSYKDPKHETLKIHHHQTKKMSLSTGQDEHHIFLDILYPDQDETFLKIYTLIKNQHKGILQPDYDENQILKIGFQRKFENTTVGEEEGHRPGEVVIEGDGGGGCRPDDVG